MRALGWRVLVIWECETRHKTAVERRLAALIEGEGSASERESTLSVAVMEHQSPTQEVDAPTRLARFQAGWSRACVPQALWILASVSKRDSSW